MQCTSRTKATSVGLILGSAYIVTCIFSLIGVTRPKEETILLKALNWGLIVDGLLTLIVSEAT